MGTCCFCREQSPCLLHQGPAGTEHWAIVFWRWPRRLGAVTCYFYWTESGNYLITSNYVACGAGLAAGGSSTPLWATLDSWGTRWEFLVPHFFLKSLRNKLPTRGGCGPLERPGPHHPAYGSASSRQGLSARIGLFQSPTRPSRPSAFPSKPSLTSGEVGELIVVIGSPPPRSRVGGTCWSWVSVLPAPHRLAHHPAHHRPGPGPAAGAGVCVLWGCALQPAGLQQGVLVRRAPCLPMHTSLREVFCCAGALQLDFVRWEYKEVLGGWRKGPSSPGGKLPGRSWVLRPPRRAAFPLPRAPSLDNPWPVGKQSPLPLPPSPPN